jgi:chorismate-pyruvate lyase|tara:strand:+ start:3935 stop:4450 length:516 start_codon:yes stop_codon:yes gene_type:complete
MKYRYLQNWKNERILSSLSTKTRLSIIDNSPLTNRLTSRTNHNFRVKVLEQSSVNNKLLSNSINIRCTGIGIYRNVVLSTDHYPDIEAHTFILEKYISGKERFLKILGQRSLGTYILKPTRFKKKQTIYKIKNNLIHRITEYKNVKKKIYVNEVFPDTFSLQNISYLGARC